MPAIRSENRVKTELYVSLNEKAKDIHEETNHCAVIALAAVTGLDYELAHAALAFEGRKTGEATHFSMIEAALEKLGYKLEGQNIRGFIERYHGFHADVLKNVTTHHPERFPAVWKDGQNYLFFTTKHVAAIVDGVNHDWTKGTAKRVKSIYRVVAIETEQPAPKKKAAPRAKKVTAEV
jgi:hypothetical protein